MGGIQTAGLIAIVAILALIVLMILKKPVKVIFKLVLNTLIGFLALFAINYLGGFIGITLAINWLNAVIVGVLGVPGLALLLMLKWLTVL